MLTYANIFYFKRICKIGGTEQFLYEIAKKYKDYDITVFYDDADINQLRRLRKLVRCKKHIKGEIVKCNKAFFNFNLDMIDDVEAEEYYFVSHANYEELHRVHGGYIPPIKNEKLTHYIGVSQFAADKFDEYAKIIGSKIRTQKCYNPLTLEPKQKVVRLASACRLDDEVKGGERTLKLIKALDKYCEENNRNYIWIIFTNPTKVQVYSPNVILMKPRLDVRPYLADSDYVLQLSNDMETYCYTINEALEYGVPIVTTPLTILNELPITENEHIVLDWNCENVDEVARQIFEKEVKPFKYTAPEDNWSNILVKKESTYEEEKNMKYLVEATDLYAKLNTYDVELSKKKNVKQYIPKQGERWEVNLERKQLLEEKGFIKVIEEVKEVETATKKVETEKAVKKTTKKAK